MRKDLLKWVTKLLLVGSLLVTSSVSAEVLAPVGIRAITQSNPSVDSLIVKMRSRQVVGTAQASNAVFPLNDDQMNLLSGLAGIQLSYLRSMSRDIHVVKLPMTLDLDQAKGLAVAISADAMVEYAEPDVRMYAQLAPNDTFYANQWHYHASASHGMNLPGAWDITTGSAAVTTAVIDTGILPHIDLAGRTVAGYDMITSTAIANDGGGRDADPTDPGDWVALNECGTNPAQNSSWHGTHVAGTIGAASNNAQGVAGVDWAGKILPIRVLGKCGGVTSDIVDGMRWAAGLTVVGLPVNPNPADVLNMSLGGTGACGATMQAAVNEIVALGKTIVVAAGNSNVDASTEQPANCTNVVTVAAHGPTSLKAPYSNFGSVVEIMAPGGDLTLTFGGFGAGSGGVASTLDLGTTTALNDNQYVYYQGTSMAAPHVAGLAALMLAANPTLTPAQILTVIQGTARAFVAGGWCALNPNNCGTGIADAHAAVLTVGPVAAPTTLSVAPASSSQINLAWSDNATNETGFKIERKTGVGGTYAQIGTAVANATAYSDVTAVAENNYYYRVRANSLYANSTYSNEANTTAIAAPSALSATAASTAQINLSWTDNSAVETGFKIEQSTNAVTYTQVGTTAANVVSFSATGLTAGTTYYFRVRATNASGDSSYSTVATAATTAAAGGGGGAFSPWLLVLLFPLSLLAIRRMRS